MLLIAVPKPILLLTMAEYFAQHVPSINLELLFFLPTLLNI
jgi:hypothetical protein